MADFSEEKLLTNQSLQADEIQALSAIFGDDWIEEDAEHKVYSIKVLTNSRNNIYFQITLPKYYPLDGPPIYEISAPWMSREEKASLCSEIEDIYCLKAGESIIYLWIEKLREFANCVSSVDLQSISSSETECNNEELSRISNVIQIMNLEEEVEELPNIFHGEPIIDQKSVFQAHVAKVVTVKQVKLILNKLKENRKIASATHNIYAYRISREHGAFIQDCEDDGETKAGSHLLHLLNILNVHNVVVVVSRWYGGIHLGADRFKHISNTARLLLQKMEWVQDAKGSDEASKISKK